MTLDELAARVQASPVLGTPDLYNMPAWSLSELQQRIAAPADEIKTANGVAFVRYAVDEGIAEIVGPVLEDDLLTNGLIYVKKTLATLQDGTTAEHG